MNVYFSIRTFALVGFGVSSSLVSLCCFLHKKRRKKVGWKKKLYMYTSRRREERRRGYVDFNDTNVRMWNRWNTCGNTKKIYVYSFYIQYECSWAELYECWRKWFDRVLMRAITIIMSILLFICKLIGIWFKSFILWEFLQGNHVFNIEKKNEINKSWAKFNRI